MAVLLVACLHVPLALTMMASRSSRHRRITDSRSWHTADSHSLVSRPIDRTFPSCLSWLAGCHYLQQVSEQAPDGVWRDAGDDVIVQHHHGAEGLARLGQRAVHAGRGAEGVALNACDAIKTSSW